MEKQKKVKNTSENEKVQSQDMAKYLFHQGANFLAYEYFGVHFEGEYITFRTWAPNADFVSVCGDFNNWNNKTHTMKKLNKGGVWEVYVDKVDTYDKYKYEITSKNNKTILLIDEKVLNEMSEN